MIENDWTFDAPTGTWRSVRATADLLGKAIDEAKVACLWRADKAHGALSRLPEFGAAAHKPESVDVLVPSLAAVLRRVRFWVVLPHIRRNDASGYRCSCGFEAPLPSEFGRVSPLRDHQVLYPDHTAAFVPRPGDSFAWYGVAAEAPADIEVAPLAEMSPIPVLALP